MARTTRATRTPETILAFVATYRRSVVGQFDWRFLLP